MERVAPPSLNYDDVLPLAIESRSNRRTFTPVNGDTFSNTNGSTIIRIDVNADSMLDPTHSYLTLSLNETSGVAHTTISPDIGCPMIKRLRIESGGVTIEDINEYNKLYAMMMLHQCPEDYVANVCSGYGLYPRNAQADLAHIAHDVRPSRGGTLGAGFDAHNLARGEPDKIKYLTTVQGLSAGITNAGVLQGDDAANRPIAAAVVNNTVAGHIPPAGSKTYVIPLLSGFLNQDKYLPLIMMNAGFTIELHLAPATDVGIGNTQQAGHAAGAAATPTWSVSNCKYVAHLIDLDREFYGKLRSVMEQSDGVLQLAGQTYRHYSGQLPAGASEYTLSLPARVKSIKSIFATFIDSVQRNAGTNYSVGVGHQPRLSSYRFEIGSVRYPQTDIKVNLENNAEVCAELQKAFGKLGDYSHSSCVSPLNMDNDEVVCNNTPLNDRLSAFMLGYDFEAFQKVALESGINTADRSLPINFVCNKGVATTNATHADFYVLSDAIYYINLDGTVSVSV